MKNKTVTSELKSIISTLTGKKVSCPVYSDKRKQGVGVKFVDLFFTQETLNVIQYNMEQRGFVHIYTRENRGGYLSQGTRFCYKKVGSECIHSVGS